METTVTTHGPETEAKKETGVKNQSNASNIAGLEPDVVSHMKKSLARQQQAFLDDGFVSAKTRIDRLERTYKMIGENQNDIIETCNLDFGNRSRHQSQMSEVLAVMSAVKHAIEQVETWMKTDKRKVMFPLNLFGTKARVEQQPKGVIGNISTWNFPVYVGISPLAGIFAAGNRAMIKFSELSPQTSALTQQLIAKYFDETECVGITGGPEVGAEFASMPFNHILFTGGTGIGRHILQAAANNLTPVTLELGGKSPVIVGRSYEINKAADRIMLGKALNMGQACLAPDYCFVPREQKEAFVSAIVDIFSKFFPTIIGNPDYTAIINARHHQRIINMIQDAKDKGAELREINPANEDFSTQKEGELKIPMTLVIDPSDDMQVMREELFAPILCIKTYDDINECIQYINSRPRPLGLYYFGEDAEEERLVLDRTISGGVTVNDVLSHASCEDLPFGGIGHSGMGNYHGHEGFLTFSHQKAVFHQTKIDVIKLAGMKPPYSKKCKKQLDKMTKVK